MKKHLLLWAIVLVTAVLAFWTTPNTTSGEPSSDRTVIDHERK